MADSWWIGLLPKGARESVAGRHMLQKVVGNSGWLFADNILRMGVGLIVSAWVARYLGPEGFGSINYAVAFVSLFASLATLGLDNIVVRDLVRNPDCRDETLGSALMLKLIGGGVTLLCTVIAINCLRPDDALTHWLVGIIAAGTLFQAFDAVGFWFQAEIRSKFVVCAKNSAFFIIAIVKIVLILQHAPLVAFAWAGLAETGLGACGLLLAYRISGNHIGRLHVNRGRMLKLLSDSWPLILSGIAIYIQARIDQVMLGDMVGSAEVGQYSAAMRLIEVFAFVPMVVQSSVAPAITSAKIAGEEQYYGRLLNVYRLMMILFLVTAVPIYFLATPIVIVVFGAEYQAAAGLLSLFALRLFFANLGVAKSLFITNENLFRYSLVTAVVGSVTNIALNYMLIPRYASQGAIWSMIISFAVTIFVIDLFYVSVRKNLKNMVLGVLTPWKFKIN